VIEPRYPFVAVDVDESVAEEVGALLFELGATGVEERDQQTLVRGAGPHGLTLVASFEANDAVTAAIAALKDYEGAHSPRLEEVVGDAWRDAWKEHFAPFSLTPTITVTPPWVHYDKQRPNELVLELEPGRAFGTGLHATTSLVAEELDEHASELAGATVLDVGCGSGILALVALLLGAERAVAIDIDPDVVEIVLENAGRNGLSDRIEAAHRTIDDVAATFPIVLANIEARVLMPMAEQLGAALEPGGKLILSGILAAEHDAIVARYTSLSPRLEHLRTRRRGDDGDAWVAIVLARPQ
jgi:ribosomal protein L11 methyltransferase